MIEDKDKNLCDDDGKTIIPKEKRQLVECYSRVVGYYRPVQNWNRGKVEEFKERKEFDMETSINSPFAKENTPTEIKSI